MFNPNLFIGLPLIQVPDHIIHLVTEVEMDSKRFPPQETDRLQHGVKYQVVQLLPDNIIQIQLDKNSPTIQMYRTYFLVAGMKTE